MKVGDELVTTHAFTVQDVLDFARVSGDGAEQHQTPDADGRLFVHGLLTASLPTRIGSRMNIWAQEMTCQWVRPVYTDEAIQCVVGVEELTPSERGTWMRVSIQCTNPAGQVVLQGHCQGMSPYALAQLSEMSVSDLSG